MNNNWRHMLLEASILANILPDWVPSPTRIDYDYEVYEDCINLEWSASQGEIMVIFMVNGRPSWAGMCDGASSHGISSVCNSVPEECLTLLRNVVTKLNKETR